VERRFGNWDAILATPQLPEELPISRANRYANRSIAFAAKGKFERADEEYVYFLRSIARVPVDAKVGFNSARAILNLEKHLAAGEIAVLKGDMELGLSELKKAVEVEDSLSYSEPPDWIQPVRHTLGAALLRAKLPQDAIAVYLEDLRRVPENGWSLLGLSQAYEQLGESELREKYLARYKKVWSKSDSSAVASCQCLPPKK
jgi:tetratricopeptide (TPR) repeat protein